MWILGTNMICLVEGTGTINFVIQVYKKFGSTNVLGFLVFFLNFLCRPEAVDNTLKQSPKKCCGMQRLSVMAGNVPLQLVIC